MATFRDGKFCVELDSDLIETIAKCGMAAGVAVEGAALVAGGTAAASSLAVPVAGTFAAGATAYALAEASKDEGKIDLIKHSHPSASRDSHLTEAPTALFTGGAGDSSILPPEERKAIVQAQNQSAAIAAQALPPDETPMDPKVANALQNFNEYKNIMEAMGFIQLEENQEYTTSKEYGCPTSHMSRSARPSLPPR